MADVMAVQQSMHMLKNFSLREIGLFLIYLALIFIIKRLIFWMLDRMVRKRNHFRYVPALESFINWITFYGVILLFLFYFSHKKWLLAPLFSTGNVDVSIFLIIVALLIVSLANRLVKTVTKEVLPSVYEYYNINKGISYTINRLIYYLVMIAALGISFTTVGLDLTALGAVLGVLGIGIGFGMRNIAGNFVSGIIMLFERPVEVGEVIEINDKIGTVERIQLRSTIVRTFLEGTLIIPNQYFIEQIIKNRTEAKMIAQVTISVAYGMDTGKVQRLLEEAVKKEKEKTYGILPNTSANIRFIDIRNKALEFLVEVPVIDFQTKEQFESRLRHSIADSFYKNGIELAPLPIDIQS